MNERNLSLVIFAFIALSAVFAFVVVLGGPEPVATGNAGAKIGTSSYKIRGAYDACMSSHCDDGLGGLPTGNYDPVRELYECKCVYSNPSFRFYRSRYTPG